MKDYRFRNIVLVIILFCVIVLDVAKCVQRGIEAQPVVTPTPRAGSVSRDRCDVGHPYVKGPAIPCLSAAGMIEALKRADTMLCPEHTEWILTATGCDGVIIHVSFTDQYGASVCRAVDEEITCRRLARRVMRRAGFRVTSRDGWFAL